MTSTSTIRLLFLCLARDCEKTIPNFLSFLQDLRDDGLECHAIIGENGSRDCSRALIQSASPMGVEHLDTKEMSKHSCRLRRMAMGRQLLLNAARGRSGGPGSFIVLADMDNVFECPPDPLAVKDAIAQLHELPELFAVGATSYPCYYDLLSMKSEKFDYSSLNGAIAKAKKNLLTYYSFHKHTIYANQLAITAAVPFDCVSSFNGFCVYIADDYLSGTYYAENMDSVCEHVTMNVSIHDRTGKMIRLDPHLRVVTPSDHRPVGQVRFYLDRIQKIAHRCFLSTSFTSGPFSE